MKKITLAGILLFTLVIGGCSNDKKAQEMLETARFEEKQHNLEHATQLYREIVKKYPGSPSAKDASTRLIILNRQQP